MDRKNICIANQPKSLIAKGKAVYLKDRRLFLFWWRRRESNPQTNFQKRLYKRLFKNR